MRRLRPLASSLAALSALSMVVAVTAAPRVAAQDLTPPVAKTIARIDTLHGDIRTDN